MAREVRRADSPVLGHVPWPRRSSTTLWMSGWATCGGYGRSKSCTPDAPSNFSGSDLNMGKVTSPSVPVRRMVSSRTAPAKLHDIEPGAPSAVLKLTATVSSTA